MQALLRSAAVLIALLAVPLAHGQVLFARLMPLSPSQGYGEATVKLVGSMLETDIYFAHLDAPSTAAYIVCCNRDPALAQPATANMIKLQVGMDHATLVEKLNMSDTAFWDSSFLGAGTTADAQTRLANALTSDQAHFVVTSTAYLAPQGELRGTFTAPTTAITMRTPRGQPYGHTLVQAGGRASIMATSGNEYRCYELSERCVFPVYVSSTRDTNGRLSCEARVDFGAIKVPPHRDPNKTIRIIWQLVEGNIGDTGDYRFMDSGIELSGNDPRQDFNAKGRESADGKRFKWQRVGKRIGRDVSYNAWVERFDPATGLSLPCKPADPLIANSN